MATGAGPKLSTEFCVGELQELCSEWIAQLQGHLTAAMACDNIHDEHDTRYHLKKMGIILRHLSKAYAEIDSMREQRKKDSAEFKRTAEEALEKRKATAE